MKYFSARRGVSMTFLTLALILGGCSANLPFFSATATPVPIYSLKNGGPCVQLGNHPAPPYANVRVSHDTYLAHSEPEIAENPNNPLNLVGGSKMFTDPKNYAFKIGYYTSFDGGCTWIDGGFLPGFEQERLVSDVSFAFGANNTVFAAVLNTDGFDESGLSVSTSTDGGKTFGLPVHVFEDKTGRVFSDKPWIAVDRSNGTHQGAIYVVWSYDYQDSDTNGYPRCGDPGQDPCTQELGFSRSTDGGKTFSAPRLISGTAPFCTNFAPGRDPSSTRCDAVLGATPALLPDGTLAVAYAYVDLTPSCDATPIPTRQVVITSTDGGTTWSTPVSVATVHDLPCSFSGEHYRLFSLPAFAADPTTGALYLVWADERNGDADILLARSGDHGLTWSAPARVNDDPLQNGANQFQPQLAVAPNGVVSVSFFDTRVDPNHKLIDVFLAQSTDHGATFLPNIRVTTASWDPAVDAPVDGSGQQFIGDYQGLAADNQFAHPFWNDTRTGAQEIYTAAIPSAQPPAQP